MNFTLPFEIFQHLPTLDPDGAALAAGTIAMDQGHDAQLLPAPILQFHPQSPQGALDQGPPLFKIDHLMKKSRRGTCSRLSFLCPATKRTERDTPGNIIAADLTKEHIRIHLHPSHRDHRLKLPQMLKQ